MSIPLPRFAFALTLLLTTFAAAQQSSRRPLITQPVDDANVITLEGSTHPLARPMFDVGAAPPDLPMNRMLLVLRRDPQQDFVLGRMLDDQQDKNSPNYHQWLTPTQFGAQFGASDQDIQLVTGWLQTHGFQINRISNGRTAIEFSGFESQVEQAFHTQIHQYVVNGQPHWANASDPQIPVALAPAVVGVVTLNNFPRQPMLQLYGKYDGRTKRLTPSNPTFTFPGGCTQSGNCYAVGPADFGTIYNLQSLWNAGIDGTGQKIAIVGRTDINVQDARDFRTLFGLPANDPIITYDGPNPGFLSDEVESDLDVQWAGAIAPKATVNLVVSASTETADGVDLSAIYIVDNNLAPVMSVSYGLCELGLGTAGNQFYNALWQQAAAQGMTVVVASGDNGAAGCDFGNSTPQPAQFGLAVSGFASTPYNVAVGGTDFNDPFNPTTYWNSSNTSPTLESAKGYIPEVPWNSTCTNGVLSQAGWSTNSETNCNDPRLSGLVLTLGGSGGVSNCTVNGQALGTCSGGYTKPSWQVGTLNDGKRDLPDISFFASSGFMGNFYVFCQADAFGSCSTTNFGGAGGTSFGAPIFAAVMSLVNQKMQTPGGQGNPNYILYKLAGQTGATCPSSSSNATCIFNDITTGTIAMPCLKGSPNCTVQNTAHQFGVLSGYGTASGYDLATGLGSVNVANLLSKWGSVQFRPTTTTLNLSPTSNLTHGQTVTVTGSVSASSGSGTPTGSVSLLTSNGQGAGTLTLRNGNLSGSTTLLPGGTYTVSAHYAGDTTFGGSDSAAVQIDVVPENSKTFANLITFDNSGNITSLNSTGATYGNGYYLLRVDVGDSSASYSPTTGITSTCSQGIASCPTGALTVTNNSSALAGGSFPLNSKGYAEDQSLTPGSYSITAKYSGDSSYSSSSATAGFAIAQAPTTITAGVAGIPVEYGNSEQIVAGISTTSNGVTPTGTVTFSVDGSPIASTMPIIYQGFPYNPNPNPPFYAWLSASGSTRFLSVGNHTLSATYSGDTNYAASSSPLTTITVSKAQTFFTSYGATPGQASWNQSVTLVAQLYGSEAGLGPTGSFTFYDGGSPISGTVTYAPNPAFAAVGLYGTMPYTPTTPGVHNITVSYSGDSNYTPATSGVVPAVLTVAGPFSVAPMGNVVVASPGQSGSTTLAINSNGGFSGTVTLTCSPDPYASEAACSFQNGSSTSSSVQVNVSGSTSATATLNVTTTAPHGALHAAFLRSWPLTLLAGLWIIPAFRRKHRGGLKFFLAALLLVTAACGGSNGSSGGGGGGGNTDPGTRVGSYAFTVTGTTGSGSSAVSVSSSVMVTVQ